MCRKITNNGVKKVFYLHVKMTKLWQIDVITAACHDEKDHIGNFSWILKLSYYIELEISIQTFRRSISSNELLFIHVYLQLKFFRPIQFLYYPISCFSFSTDPTDKRNFINKWEKKEYLIGSLTACGYCLVRGQQLFVWPDKKIIFSRILNQKRLGVGQ